MRFMLTSYAFRQLYNQNRRSPEVYKSFRFWPPLRKLRRRTVARAWIGIWSPTLAALISRWSMWRIGRRKTPCERCGEVCVTRDLHLGGKDDLDMLCSGCWILDVVIEGSP